MPFWKRRAARGVGHEERTQGLRPNWNIGLLEIGYKGIALKLVKRYTPLCLPIFPFIHNSIIPCAIGEPGIA
jgi:hypothetical protein